MRYEAPWPGMTWVDMMLAAVAARDRAEVARREMRFFLNLANPPKFPPGDILGLDLLTLMDKPREAKK